MNRRRFLPRLGLLAGGLAVAPHVLTARAEATVLQLAAAFSDVSLVARSLTFLHSWRELWVIDARMSDLVRQTVARLTLADVWRRLRLTAEVRGFYEGLLVDYPEYLAGFWLAPPSAPDALRTLATQGLLGEAGVDGVAVTDDQQISALVLVSELLDQRGGLLAGRSRQRWQHRQFSVRQPAGRVFGQTVDPHAVDYQCETARLWAVERWFTPVPEAAAIVAECRANLEAAVAMSSGGIGEVDHIPGLQLELLAMAARAGVAGVDLELFTRHQQGGLWSSKIGVTAPDVSATGLIVDAIPADLSSLDLLEPALEGIRRSRRQDGDLGMWTAADEDVLESSQFGCRVLG